MFNKIKEIFLKKYKWLICFICLFCFLLLAEDVFTKEIIQIDDIVYKFIASHFISNSLTPIVKIITFFGSATWIVIFTIILFVIIRNKRQNILLGTNLCIVTIINQILKHIFKRSRPTEFRIIDESGYSFPSGHSMVSMAFYGYLIYLVYKNIKNKYLKWILIIVLSILIILIGISRIYLGVHYTSDVLGGYLLSVSYLVLFIHITNSMEK